MKIPDMLGYAVKRMGIPEGWRLVGEEDGQVWLKSPVEDAFRLRLVHDATGVICQLVVSRQELRAAESVTSQAQMLLERCRVLLDTAKQYSAQISAGAADEVTIKVTVSKGDRLHIMTTKGEDSPFALRDNGVEFLRKKRSAK